MKHAVAITLALGVGGQLCAAPDDFALDIKGTSLVELMDLKITSLSRKQEEVSQAPAAVYVITSDQIRRMGVNHIAEALRYAPGVEVARLGANRWAISIRGFNSGNANKLLVMIDGRSIYSPLYAGVFWEEKDVLLEDVERIEVIRGPGGTQWGANAVNGVINIITKSAEDTQGGLVKVGVGLEERHLTAVRYGWELGEDRYARVYGKFTRRDDSALVGATADNSQMGQVGFRLDQDSSEQGDMTLQGDLYRGELGPEYEGLETPGEEYSGGNLQFRWNAWQSRTRNHEFFAYYERTHLETGEFDDARQVWNLEYRLLQRWRNHEVVAGLGYRHLSDEVKGPASPLQVRFEPQRRTDEVRSAFVQDDMAFLNDRLHLIIGTKFEENGYSEDEWQPSVRTSYALSGSSLVWAAWSQAVRTPTRLEHNIVLSDPDTGQVALDADEQMNPEYADFYELGWRKSWADTWQLDMAAYLGRYQDLRTLVRSPNAGSALAFGNQMHGEIQGVEASISVQAAAQWLVRLNASHAELELTSERGNLEPGQAEFIAGSTPQDSVNLMSLWDINAQWQLNTYLRYVDELPAVDAPSYWAGDLSLVWRPLEQTRVQLVGRHLGDGDTQQWTPGTNAVEPDWAIYLTQGF